MNQGQPQHLQTQQNNEDEQEKPEGSLTAIFRPDSEFRELLERARAEKAYMEQLESTRSEKAGQHQPIPSGVSAWDTNSKEDEEDGKEDEPGIDDDDATSTSSEDDGKMWRARRTLRKSVLSVRVEVL